MKAGMNGVINLSVLDGWWDEGYQGDNGWAIKPASSLLDAERRDREDAATLYEILQYQTVPLYYGRGDMGYSQEWIAMAKRSMASLLPRFSTTRMVNEYVTKFYVPASAQGRRYNEKNFEGREDGGFVEGARARRMAGRHRAARRQSATPHPVRGQHTDRGRGQPERARSPATSSSSCCSARGLQEPTRASCSQELAAAGAIDGTTEHRYVLALKPELCGRLDYRLRLYPRHELLTHRFELGLMLWI